MSHIAVVGAGQAALSVLTKLRALGFQGRLTLIGDEPTLPYRRPALSKKYLLGEMSADHLLLRLESFYSDNGIAVRLGTPATHLDTDVRTFNVGSEVISYDSLVLATGSLPRALPPSIHNGLEGVYSIRSIQDVDALASEFREARRLLVIGGGYIGLEAAAVAAKKGLKVTLVEASDRILARVASAETSAYFRDLHRRSGVVLCEGISVRELIGDGRVSGAILSDGSRLDADFVIVGVGAVPATSLAEAAGIVCDNGIVVDEAGRTSAPDVWAAGDCTSFPWRNMRVRLECVQNAIDQAEIVASNLMDRQVAYDPTPWFWSDQFDTKLQIAGWNFGYDRVVTREVNERRKSVWYYRGDQLCAVDAMDDPQAYMVGKQLLQARRSLDPEKVSDPAIDLKSLLR